MRGFRGSGAILGLSSGRFLGTLRPAMYKHPRSPYDKVGGIVYFGRMADKIRLHAAGELHPDWAENMGVHFDKRCTDFLRVEYADFAAVVRGGLDDAAALAWCYANGRKPSDEEIEVWNGFMMKRGWRDEGAKRLGERKAEGGFAGRDDIATMFDYIDADEGRPVRKW